MIADMNEKGQPLPSGLASLQAQGLAGKREGGGVVLCPVLCLSCCACGFLTRRHGVATVCAP